MIEQKYIRILEEVAVETAPVLKLYFMSYKYQIHGELNQEKIKTRINKNVYKDIIP